MIQTVKSMPPRRATVAVLTRPVPMPDAPSQAPATADIDPVLTAFLAGAADAADHFVATYGGVVREAIGRFLALKVRGRADLTDDLTHEVFLALFRDDGRKLRTFSGRDGCSLAGWLKVVAVRLTIDRLRRDSRMVALDDDTPGMTELRRTLRSEEPSPEESMQGAETAERLSLAMAELGPKDRLLAELHLVRGRALEDVAEVLGVTMNAAYVRKSRLLERLRRTLGSVR